MIEPLLSKTLTCLDQSLSDAKIQAPEIDKVVLVGGATRTPMVHRLLQERLGRPVHSEIEPDLAVAMGAAVQGGLITGVIGGAPQQETADSWDEDRLIAALQKHLDAGLSRRDAVKAVAEESGIERRVVYDLSLRL